MRLNVKELALMSTNSDSSTRRILYNHLVINKITTRYIILVLICHHQINKSLMHDNAPIHTAVISQATITKCSFQELEHPLYCQIENMWRQSEMPWTIYA